MTISFQAVDSFPQLRGRQSADPISTAPGATIDGDGVRCIPKVMQVTQATNHRRPSIQLVDFQPGDPSSNPGNWEDQVQIWLGWLNKKLEPTYDYMEVANAIQQYYNWMVLHQLIWNNVVACCVFFISK